MEKLNYINILFLNALFSYFLAYDYFNNKNYLIYIILIILSLFILFIFIYSKSRKNLIRFILVFIFGIFFFLYNPSIQNKKFNFYVNDLVTYLKFQKKIYLNKDNYLNNIISFKEDKLNKITLLFSIDEDMNLYKYEKGKISIINELNKKIHLIFAKFEEENKYFFSTIGSKIILKNLKGDLLEKNLKFHHWPHITNNNIFVPSYDLSLKNKENFNEFLELTRLSKNLKDCKFDFKNIPTIDAVDIFDKNLNQFNKFNYLYTILKNETVRNKLSNLRCDDFLHLNFIYELKEDDTRKISGSKKGDLLLTFRSYDGVILLSRSSDKVIYEYQLLKSKPHSGFINANGNLILFDNISQDITRILEIDPSNNKIIGEFKNKKFQSATRGLIYEININKYLIIYNNSGKIVFLDCKKNINQSCYNSVIIDSYKQISGGSINY